MFHYCIKVERFLLMLIGRLVQSEEGPLHYSMAVSEAMGFLRLWEE